MTKQTPSKSSSTCFKQTPKQMLKRLPSTLPTRPVVVRNPTVDPLPIVTLAAKTRTTYETPTPDRLADLERATVADAELIHDCRWRAEAARQRIANRKAEIVRLREAA